MTRVIKAALSAALALGLLSGAASARTVFDDIRDAAPHSAGVFADIQNSAPRSPFDQIRDSAPRSDGVFGQLQNSAP